MTSGRKSPGHRTAAFTVVELVVAAGLTLLVVIGLVALLRQAGDVAGRSTDRLSLTLQAERVLDYLVADLQAIVGPRDGAVGLVAVVAPDRPETGVAGEAWAGPAGAILKPTAAEGSLQLEGPLATQRFGPAGLWLAFFTAQPWPSGAGSGPVAVSYQLVRRRETPTSPPTYQLLRAWVGPEQTFAAGYDLGAGASYWLPDDTPRAAGNVVRPPATAVLANHVVNWGVRFLTLSASGEEDRLFPPRDPPWAYVAVSPAAYPSHADIVLQVLTEEGARQIARLEELPAGRRGGVDWWSVADAHSVVFTRRVRLLARP